MCSPIEDQCLDSGNRLKIDKKHAKSTTTDIVFDILQKTEVSFHYTEYRLECYFIVSKVESRDRRAGILSACVLTLSPDFGAI